MHPASHALELFGQTEVHHSQSAVQGDDHVLRLEVPVQDAVGVSFFEGLDDGEHDAQRLLQPRRSLLHPLSQILTLEILERYVGPASMLAGGVDGHDVGMVELRGGPNLEQESLDGLVRRQPLAGDHLQCHPPTQLGVVGQIDLAHPAAAQQPDDLEMLDHGARLAGKRCGFLVRSHLASRSGLSERIDALGGAPLSGGAPGTSISLLVHPHWLADGNTPMPLKPRAPRSLVRRPLRPAQHSPPLRSVVTLMVHDLL